ncbi:hypothetical protein TrVE_jg6904 [Triparma verrucosa]|nr:hypothetical protein TrVE_jg6904 [Triparma verrucosa]
MSLATNLRPTKKFRFKEHRDWKEAVAQSSNMNEWDTRKIVVSPHERAAYYTNLVTEMMADEKGLTPPRGPKTLHFGHTFLPQFPPERTPSIITFLKNPVHRLSSAYNYVRHGSQTPKIRQRNIEKLGDATLSECFRNSTCSSINNLRKHCSLQALSLCGGYDLDCNVHWHLIDSENYKEKLEKMIDRALKHLETEVLIAGVTEDMDLSLSLLETLLPTYFEGITSLSISSSSLSKNTTIEFDRTWQTSSGNIVSNVASKYEKPKKEEEDDMMKDICYADYRVWTRAREILREKKNVCDDRAENDKKGYEKYQLELVEIRKENKRRRTSEEKLFETEL